MVMEHTELVEKYVNGEIDDTAFNAAFEKLETADKTVVTEALKVAKPKILSEISALRKEKERVAALKIEGEKPPEDFIKKFRGEQVEKAMKRFFTDKNVEEADQAIIKANFLKLDDQAIDADLIGDNLKRVYAYSFPDKLVTVSKEAGEEGAANFNSRQAGSAGKTGSPVDIKEDDPRIAKVLAEARKEGISMTADEAKRGLEAGIKRGSNWGGLKPLPKV
jgi:hypothetical protein